MKPVLLIAIPTFNRNAILLENLKCLLPQLTAETRLIILDNNSDIPVSYSLQAISDDLRKQKIEIIRNRINIGGAANILRCFELCDTEWLWILGDDDKPSPNAVETILLKVKQEPGCIYFNFSSDIIMRKNSFVTVGQEEFIHKTDSWSNTLFISANIYNKSAIKDHIKIGYAFGGSVALQFAILLSALKAEKKCYFSNERIIGISAIAQDNSWNNLVLCNCFELLKLVNNRSAQRKLAKDISRYIPSMRQLAYELLSRSAVDPDIASALYYYDIAYFQMSYCNKDLNLWLKYKVYRFYYLSYKIFRFKPVRFLFKLIKGKEMPSISDENFADLHYFRV